MLPDLVPWFIIAIESMLLAVAVVQMVKMSDRLERMGKVYDRSLANMKVDSDRREQSLIELMDEVRGSRRPPADSKKPKLS